MRKFVLTLAERILLRPVVANNWFQGNIEQQHRAWEILQAIDLSEIEGALIPLEGVINMADLPASSKEVTLEDRNYEFLVGLLARYPHWLGPSKWLFSMVDAVKEAEKVKPGDRAD